MEGDSLRGAILQFYMARERANFDYIVPSVGKVACALLLPYALFPSQSQFT